MIFLVTVVINIQILRHGNYYENWKSCTLSANSNLGSVHTILKRGVVRLMELLTVEEKQKLYTEFSA